MSGHSKWSTIKHQKAVTDQKRGKAFSKLAKIITIAAKEGQSGDVESNSRLRLAIELAKAGNMPKENIKRAIDRGLGKGEGSELVSVVYEGFGPEKVACLAECVTDNKNRTGAEIKSFFERGGGGLGSPGSTAYLFEKKGLILVEAGSDPEEQILKLIDFGIDDVNQEEGIIEVYTQSSKLEKTKEQVIKAGFAIKEASLVLKPTTLVPVKDSHKQEKIIAFLQALEDLDDVLRVYCNVDIIK